MIMVKKQIIPGVEKYIIDADKVGLFEDVNKHIPGFVFDATRESIKRMIATDFENWISDRSGCINIQQVLDVFGEDYVINMVDEYKSEDRDMKVYSDMMSSAFHTHAFDISREKLAQENFDEDIEDDIDDDFFEEDFDEEDFDEEDFNYDDFADEISKEIDEYNKQMAKKTS